MNKMLFIPTMFLSLILVSPTWAKDEHRAGHGRDDVARNHDRHRSDHNGEYRQDRGHGRAADQRHRAQKHYPGHHRDEHAQARHAQRHHRHAYDERAGRRYFAPKKHHRYHEVPRSRFWQRNDYNRQYNNSRQYYNRPFDTRYYRGSSYQGGSGDVYRQLGAEILTNEIIIRSRR